MARLAVCSLLALLLVGCRSQLLVPATGDATRVDDMAVAAADGSGVVDLATPAPDLVVAPPDLTRPWTCTPTVIGAGWSPILVDDRVAFDAGGLVRVVKLPEQTTIFEWDHAQTIWNFQFGGDFFTVDLKAGSAYEFETFVSTCRVASRPITKDRIPGR